MTFETYIIFIVSSIVVNFVPGPTVLLSVNYALCYGKMITRYTVPAVLIGDIIAVNIAFSGLGIILQYSQNLFFLLKTLGGLYIFSLGLIDMFSNSKLNEQDKLTALPKRRVFIRLMLVTAFNPKSIIFLLAFFPQFLNPRVNNFSQMIIMGITFVIIGIFCTLFYTLTASKIFQLINNRFIHQNLHYFTAILLCLIGLLMLM